MSKDTLAREFLSTLAENFQPAYETSYVQITSVKPVSDTQTIRSATGTVNKLTGVPIKTLGYNVAENEIWQVRRPIGQAVGAQWEVTGERISTRPTAGIVNPAITIPSPAITSIASAAYAPTTGGTASRMEVTFTPVEDRYAPSYYEIAYCTLAEYSDPLKGGSVTWQWPKIVVTHVDSQTSLLGVIPDLQPGVAYRVKMRVLNPYNQWSDWTAVQNITAASDTIAPAIPTGLAASVTTPGMLYVTWNQNSETDLAWYDLQIYDGADALQSTVSVPSNNWTLTLAPGTVRKFKVRAVDLASNASNYSAFAGPYTVAATGSGGVNVSLRSWNNNATWVVTDLDTISWNAHTITFADGTSYSIGAANTGNMAALTYIYLDIAISTTAYQLTTTWSTAVGDGKVIVAIAKNGTAKASVVPQNGALPAIGAELIVTTSLAALSATMGALTVDTSLTIGASGYLSCNSDKLRIDASAIKLKEGWAGNNYMIHYGSWASQYQYFQHRFRDYAGYAEHYQIMNGDGLSQGEATANPSELGWRCDETNAISGHAGHTRIILEATYQAYDIASLIIYQGANYGAATKVADLGASLKVKGYLYPGTGSVIQTTRYFSDDGANLVANGRFNVVGNMGIRATAALIGYGATSTILTIAGNGAAEGIAALELSGNPTDADGAVITDINAWHANNAANYQRIALIRMMTHGTTATKRGGKIQFWVQPDNSAGIVMAYQLDKDGHFLPNSTGHNIGDASNYINIIHYHTLTAHSDFIEIDPLEAMQAIRGIKAKNKIHDKTGLKLLDKKSFPSWAYVPSELVEDKNGKMVAGDDGINPDINQSTLLAAIRNLDNRLVAGGL